MKLLVITQKVDQNDPILGFFHRWLEEFAKHYEALVVICLEGGKYYLPNNVKVLSLGKETGRSRVKYLLNFYKDIWQERKNYDAVFVHMNQEYVFLGAILWKLGGKKITMWRNHYAGNWLTTLAVFLCDKVFCTSKYSYTARYRKTILMPVGIDLNLFKPDTRIIRISRSVLFLARMAPSKKPHLLLQALGWLQDSGLDFRASFYGDPASRDEVYYNSLKKLVRKLDLSARVVFKNSLPNTETASVYNQHEIFVNLSSSGMYDKTIFEAAACEALPLSSNKNLAGEIDPRLIFEESVAEDLARKLNALLELPEEEKQRLRAVVRSYTLTKHSLSLLAKRLVSEIND